MSSTLAQVQRVLDQVIRAVEFLFGFTLAAGLVVLFAAITATREERAREFAIMRAVGARASLLRQVQRAELAGVGLLAGFLASVVALAVGWGLARFVFDFNWTGSWTVPVFGSLAGAVLALAAGWWGLTVCFEYACGGDLAEGSIGSGLAPAVRLLLRVAGRGLPGGKSLSFASPKKSHQRKGDPQSGSLRFATGSLRCSSYGGVSRKLAFGSNKREP